MLKSTSCFFKNIFLFRILETVSSEEGGRGCLLVEVDLPDGSLLRSEFDQFSPQKKPDLFIRFQFNTTMQNVTFSLSGYPSLNQLYFQCRRQKFATCIETSKNFVGNIQNVFFEPFVLMSKLFQLSFMISINWFQLVSSGGGRHKIPDY